MLLPHAQKQGRALRATLRSSSALAAVACALLTAGEAKAQFDCTSLDPTDHPPGSKPYFMLVVDTSGSMIGCTNPSNSAYQHPNSCPTLPGNVNFNSCGLEPTRINDAKCALRKTVQAFAGQVNFGLETFAVNFGSCNANAGTCADSCTAMDGSCDPPDGIGGIEGEYYDGDGCDVSGFVDDRDGETCGNEPDCSGGPAPTAALFGEDWENGGKVVVGLLQDRTWDPDNQPGSNVDDLLQWFDNDCGDSKELFAIGGTPLYGSLRTVHQYLHWGWSSQWNDSNYCTPGGSPSGPTPDFLTPLDTLDDRPCRSLNVILVTDGAQSESCEGDTGGTINFPPSGAAADLFNTGVTIQGVQVPIRTHVIGFAGVDPDDVNPIADAGDNGAIDSSKTALTAANEVQLAQALAEIISGVIDPEVCNNIDDNCNGCIDEGFVHYCNENPTCCDWNTEAERDQCLADFEASIDANAPDGDPDLLPCTTAPQSQDRTTGLCYDPGDICDDADNNCDGAEDENQLKCGSPLMCPVPEQCNDQDDDCDGIVDNASGSSIPFSACPNNCQPSPEICDGCDNDCDGVADNDAPTFTCGFASPPHCSGTQTCVPVSVPVGQCTGTGSTLSQCTNDTTRIEICNGEDDNCDGVVDNNVTDVGNSCTPNPGDPTIGECRAGTTICQNGAEVCVGYQGPTPEVCDGKDNDCDGEFDEGVTQGVGNACGNTTGVCTPGQTACVGGAIVCTGGTQPDVEVCNGLDDDCDGLTDELPLDDGPPSTGCWTVSGNGCSHTGDINTVSWDAPPGATCTGPGSLVEPCRVGTLLCRGAEGWACLGSFPPGPETCDGQDNDCDGVPDDGVPAPGTTCGTDEGECEFGALVCTAGVEGCQGGMGPNPEVCDGRDNDCDGEIDEGVPGVGVVCGTNRGECNQGLTACVDGELVCQGETPPVPEICNGLDDNCDGAIDNALSDIPANPGCWNVAGNSCSHSNATWDPPAGATCSGVGTLTSPCVAGRLVCQGTQQWVCVGGRLPQASEICDGIDNDCNGGVDDGNPGGGGQCGTTDVGECEFGNLVCQNGNLVCVGEVKPKPELCDNKDNDCNNQIDDNVPGEGNACGSSTGACSPGQTACVGGILVCQGGTQSTPEFCDGIDNDCNGRVDDGALQDAPTDPGCWDNAGVACSYANATWDPPDGATCSGLGTLSTPCTLGQLVCDGVNFWRCSGGQLPVPEVCDGQDNNCDGDVDDGNPGSGGECGTDVGECQIGVQNCVSGVVSCTGNVEPAPELCDGLDNDCDGTIDNGIALGSACAAAYDRTQYPGDRSQGECRPGSLICDSEVQGGQRCEGGVGPSPEICDGKDNDCDGLVDEAGPAPDGVDGTTDPQDDSRKIGDECGTDVGECRFGKLRCVNARVVCAGGRTASRETCDCSDNDCDGEVDEDSTDEPICGGDLDCVDYNGICQCADRCGSSEFPCATGTFCATVGLSNDPDQEGRYCVSDPCGECGSKSVTNTAGELLCAPAGTRRDDGSPAPECVCKGNDGCRDPCFGVDCEDGFRCVSVGNFASTCQPEDNCNFFGCPDGRACRAGLCVDDPCDPNPCAATEVCRPTPDFNDSRCTGSCAEIDCDAGERCLDGECVPDCNPACENDEVCVTPAAQLDAGLACGPNLCAGPGAEEPTCPDGSYCAPATGTCGPDPCSGVKCPGEQICELGQCRLPPDPPSNTGGAGGMADAGTSGGSGGLGGAGGSGGQTDAGMEAGDGGGGNAAGAGGGDDSNAVFGLATGGGGCACGTVSGRPPTPGALALTALLLGAFAARRRHQDRQGGAR